VESAELAAGVVDESLAGGDVGDIGLHYDGTPAGGFNLLSRLRQVRLVAAMNTDGRPRPAECDRQRPTDPAAAAGDQRRFAVQRKEAIEDRMCGHTDLQFPLPGTQGRGLG